MCSWLLTLYFIHCHTHEYIQHSTGCYLSNWFKKNEKKKKWNKQEWMTNVVFCFSVDYYYFVSQFSNLITKLLLGSHLKLQKVLHWKQKINKMRIERFYLKKKKELWTMSFWSLFSIFHFTDGGQILCNQISLMFKIRHIQIDKLIHWTCFFLQYQTLLSSLIPLCF